MRLSPLRRRAAGVGAIVAASLAVTASAASAVTVCSSGCDATTIQGGVNAASAGDTVSVAPGTYDEDVLVNKTLTLSGAGAGTTKITGPSGGQSSTVAAAAPGVVVEGFTITRDGNNVAQWNDPGLNSAGISVQGQGNTVEVRQVTLTGNRTGIDINNSNGNSVHNNVIDDNRTGMIFRNRTDNTSVTQNSISNNWTVGVLFLDGSNGTNSPVQSAASSTFTNNAIAGNWYGQMVDRQTGGSLPAPGSNLKNFSGNWLGTTSPVFTSANSTEPGYAAQIPTEFGGASSAPGGQPDVAGPASANIDYTPFLWTGTDTSAAPGFQGDFSQLGVTASGGQTGSSGRIQEGIGAVSAAGTVHLLGETFAETADVNKQMTLTGAGTSSVVDPPGNGPAIAISGSGTQAQPLRVSSLKATGAGGGGNTGSGLAITNTVSDVTIDHVTSTANTGNGLAVNTGGSLTRLALDTVDFSGNGNDGVRFPSSMAGLDGLTITGGHFDDNAFAGMEIYGPPSTVPVTNVTITGATFSRDLVKGIYAERLDSALLDGITVDQSGTTGSFAAGIDLNLKKQAFSDITIQNSSITRSGTGDTTNGVGLTIKSRDDGSNGPTSLSGVTVMHNTITGNQNGIRLGETGKNNLGPTDVHVNLNDLSGNLGTGMVNVTQTTPADGECNWWGSSTGPAPGYVGPGVDFTPWLQSSNLDGPCAGGTARGDKFQALNDLSGIVPSGSKDTDKRVNDAIKHIQHSLDSSAWIDDNHIAEKQGDKVFDEEKAAVKALMDIKGTAPAGATQAINDLLEADRKLAQTAIDDMAGGDPKKLAAANKAMDEAQQEIAKGHYDKAVDKYKEAWKQAQKA